MMSKEERQRRARRRAEITVRGPGPRADEVARYLQEDEGYLVLRDRVTHPAPSEHVEFSFVYGAHAADEIFDLLKARFGAVRCWPCSVGEGLCPHDFRVAVSD